MISLKNILLFSFFSLTSAVFISCDKVDDPYEGVLVSACERIPGAVNIWGDTANVTVKKMIIEEITGHTCGNCPPKTALIIDWVDNDYKNQVYSVAFHATAFAEPVRGYPADFRTEKGTGLNDKLQNTSAPVAIFNRTDLNGTGLLVGGGKFNLEFEKLINNGALDKPRIQLKLHNQYDETNNLTQLSITGSALEDLAGDFTLIIYVLEDKIISDQKYYGFPAGDHITDFEHRHMFRDAIGSLDGNAFISKELNKGEKVEKCFSYSIDSNWNIYNCVYLVAVKDNSTGEIIQSDEIHASNQ